MYLAVLNYTAYFFSFIFLALLIRSLNWKQLVFFWKKARAKIQTPIQQKELEKQGMRPFYFEKGTVVVYAKTQARAIFDYKEMKRAKKNQTKKAMANLKKV